MIGIAISPVAGAVRQASPLLNSLVAFWKLEEASGTRTDSYGANHLTPIATPGNAAGKIGNAAQFVAASTQYLQIVDNAALSMGDIDFTISAWVYLDTKTARQAIVSKLTGSGNQREYALVYEQTTDRFRLNLSGAGTNIDVTRDANTFGSPSTGTWYHVVAWHDSVNNQAGIAVNAGGADTTTWSGGVFNGTASFQIGLFNGASPMNGRIDAVGIWKRVLTSTERAMLYNGGAGIEYPFESHEGAALALTVATPGAYQVAQRSGTTANIPISGLCVNGGHTIEARWNDGAWQTITTSQVGYYSGMLSNQAQGQGTLDVRLVDNPGVSVSKSFVGIGEVFIIGGQSNAVGRGTNNQVYSHATLKACLFGNDYIWKELVDPVDIDTGQIDTVSDDNNAAGSVWPLLATHLMSNLGVPVAFVPCPLSGTSITQWQPGADHQNRATLYGSMIYRALQTGRRVILWWQGERDGGDGMSQATYNGHLDTLANAIYADLGVKLMPCKLQAGPTGQATINAAIGEAWGDNINVAAGPDLSGLTANDGLHLTSDGNLASAATLWWTAIRTAFGW